MFYPIPGVLYLAAQITSGKWKQVHFCAGGRGWMVHHVVMFTNYVAGCLNLHKKRLLYQQSTI